MQASWTKLDAHTWAIKVLDPTATDRSGEVVQVIKKSDGSGKNVRLGERAAVHNDGRVSIYRIDRSHPKQEEEAA